MILKLPDISCTICNRNAEPWDPEQQNQCINVSYNIVHFVYQLIGLVKAEKQQFIMTY